MMRTNKLFAFLLLLAAFLASGNQAYMQNAMSAEEAMMKLKEGNERFSNDQRRHPNQSKERRVETNANGQHPYVTIITCSDSRVPVEQIFDAGIGDIFVIRVAGNVVNTNEAGSIEYGVDHLHTPLFVVLGHTRCGAVTAAATHAEVHGNIPYLIKSIEPAVDKAKKELSEEDEHLLVPLSIEKNIWKSIEDLLTLSHTTSGLVKEGKLKIEGALYNIETGKVEWLGAHPHQKEILRIVNH